jgi:hypothetical protein
MLKAIPRRGTVQFKSFLPKRLGRVLECELCWEKAPFTALYFKKAFSLIRWGRDSVSLPHGILFLCKRGGL